MTAIKEFAQQVVSNVERVIMTHRLLRNGKARYVIVSGATENPVLAMPSGPNNCASSTASNGLPVSRSSNPPARSSATE